MNVGQPRELGDGGRGWPMVRGSLHLSMVVQGDHLYDERDVAADPVRRMDPTGNLEGEVLVEHHRQLVDAIDVDAQGECSSVIVRCHLDDERQGQDVTKGKLRHPGRALEPGPNIECLGSRIHLGMIGDEGALDPHQNETRTAWSVSFRRAACGHCPLAHGRRLGSSPDVDSRVTPNVTSGLVAIPGRLPSDQLDRRSRTAATTLASWASKVSSCSASAALATKGCRSQATPPRHIRSMARVAVMSVNGSADTRTRSARCPAATRPRSAKPKTRAGSAVAAARACVGLMPHRTRSSSSRCRLAPNTVPGFGASVPASRVTPASASRRTLSSAREYGGICRPCHPEASEVNRRTQASPSTSATPGYAG